MPRRRYSAVDRAGSDCTDCLGAYMSIPAAMGYAWLVATGATATYPSFYDTVTYPYAYDPETPTLL